MCARGSGTCGTHIVAQTSQEIDIKIPSKLRFHPRVYPYNLLNYNVFSSMSLSSDLRHYCILRSTNRDLPCKVTQNHQVNRQFERSSIFFCCSKVPRGAKLQVEQNPQPTTKAHFCFRTNSLQRLCSSSFRLWTDSWPSRRKYTCRSPDNTIKYKSMIAVKTQKLTS